VKPATNICHVSVQNSFQNSSSNQWLRSQLTIRTYILIMLLLVTSGFGDVSLPQNNE